MKTTYIVETFFFTKATYNIKSREYLFGSGSTEVYFGIEKQEPSDNCEYWFVLILV